MSMIYHRTIEYRALAIDLERSGHPVQAILYNGVKADEWAHLTANQNGCDVKLFVLKEFLLKTVKPTKARKADPNKRSKPREL
jgi:hypothetical protein